MPNLLVFIKFHSQNHFLLNLSQSPTCQPPL